jgi:hypothetical protein
VARSLLAGRRGTAGDGSRGRRALAADRRRHERIKSGKEGSCEREGPRRRGRRGVSRLES